MFGFRHSSHGGGKSKIALTALTLLSFLFFLNILQNCLQEHMDAMNPQQVVIMQARIKQIREADKRKGDTENPKDDFPSNTTSLFSFFGKESPTNKQREDTPHHQIPVKLKTIDQTRRGVWTNN